MGGGQLVRRREGQVEEVGRCRGEADAILTSLLSEFICYIFAR